MSNIKFASNPLGVISIFGGIFEVAVAISATNLTGVLQIWVIIFGGVFALLTLSLFAYILIKMPLNLYPPSEYGSPGVKEFSDALRGKSTDEPGESKEPAELRDNKVDILSDEEENKSEEFEDDANGTAYELWAKAYFDEKNYEVALKIAEDTLSKVEGEERINWRIRVFFVIGKMDFEDGREDGRKLLDEYKDDFSTYYWVSDFYENASQFHEALKILDLGFNNLDDESERTGLNLGKAELYEKLRETGKQKEILETVINGPSNSNQKSIAYRNLGNIAKNNNGLTEATKAYLNAYHASPSNTDNIRKIARFFMENLDYKRELFFRNRIVELKPTANDWTLLGNCYLMNSFNNLAMNAYEKGNEIAEGTEGWIIGNMGNLFNHAGLYSLASKSFEEALELETDSQYSHENLAKAMENIEKEEEAKEKILSSLILDPVNIVDEENLAD